MSTQVPPTYLPPKKPWNPLAVILGLSTVFFLLFLAVSGSYWMNRNRHSSGSRASGNIFATGAVGLVELNGVIMDSKKFIKQFEELEEDESVRAIVVRLNSPGGSVAPSQEIYEAVKASKKPVVASMSSVAASGAFYVAMAAKKVYANPGTITGSIGVIMEFLNLEKLYEWAKVKRFSIKTGKFKDAGAEYREMTSEERALLQGMVDDVLLQFKKAVAEGRKLPLEKVSLIADGRIFSGSQAKAIKLVDELGTLQDAVNDAGKMGKIRGKPVLVYPDRPKKNRLLELLTDNSDAEESESTVPPMESGITGLLRGLLFPGQGRSSSLEQRVLGVEPGVYWLWEGARG